MRIGTLDILRCPYCGGRLELVESMFHNREAGEIHDGVLACQCCLFPIVDGVPVMHLLQAATTAREQIQAARPDLARRTMFGLEDGDRADLFDRVAVSRESTYRQAVETLGPGFEGGYFLYRFSDPTFLVAQGVVKAAASTVLGGTRRAIDICGGSGHLTRTLLEYSAEPPILADLYYAKVWLARRFTAPGCEPVCCDGNAPMPFARGAFRLAMCTDAFMFIWTKRQFIGEMARLVDDSEGRAPGAVLIGHTHNMRTWSQSHGQALTPEGYAALFETIEPRLFAEAGLLGDLIERGSIDLGRRDEPAALDRDPALTIVATRHPGVLRRHDIEPVSRASGEFRINPLYRPEADGARLRLRLRFPDGEYEQEYGACRRYLPDEITVDRALLERLPAALLPPELAELVRRRVVLDLPVGYY